MKTYLVTYKSAHNNLRGEVTAPSKEQAIEAARKAWGIKDAKGWTAEVVCMEVAA